MTKPTDKHQQEAREILRACEQRTGVFLGSGSELNDFVSHVAAALSARDAEIREVLEGLRMGGKNDGGCWCIESPIRTREPDWKHNRYCLAARGLWERVQVSVKKEESDVVK